MLKSLSLSLAAALCSTAVYADDTAQQYQDVYVSGSYSSHELLDKSGDAYGLHFGARDIYENSFFIGGELEAIVVDNSSLKNWANLDEQYAFSANIPVGKRFYVSDDLAIDAYGLIGYSLLDTKPSLEEDAHGVKYGGGLDLNIYDWMLGVRYTRVDLKYNLDQEDITLLIGYKFNL